MLSLRLFTIGNNKIGPDCSLKLDISLNRDLPNWVKTDRRILKVNINGILIIRYYYYYYYLSQNYN